MEDFEDVSNVIKTHSLVKQEFEKGSNKGLVFEDQVGDILETFTNISGDFIDRVGNTEGASKTGKGKKKETMSSLLEMQMVILLGWFLRLKISAKNHQLIL